MTETFQQFYRRILRVHVGIILGAGLFSFVLGYRELACGMALGGVVGALVFRYFYGTITRLETASVMEKKKSFALFFMRYIVVYSIIALVLWGILQWSLYAFIGFAVGVLAIKGQLFFSGIKG